MRKLAAAENATVPQLITRPVCRFGVAFGSCRTTRSLHHLGLRVRAVSGLCGPSLPNRRKSLPARTMPIGTSEANRLVTYLGATVLIPERGLACG
jgi:hypothetical protein